VGVNGNSSCIDAEASADAVTELSAAGIPTYVIGMPGSEVYGSLLDSLALAGGTARAEQPSYYAVSDASELSQALAGIGAQVALGCRIALATPPEDTALVNVYLDDEILPSNDESGWSWVATNGPAAEGAASRAAGAAAPDTWQAANPELALELRGESCRALQAGEVRKVEITYGCQTIVR
jgi:hypothetical protein